MNEWNYLEEKVPEIFNSVEKLDKKVESLHKDSAFKDTNKRLDELTLKLSQLEESTSAYKDLIATSHIEFRDAYDKEAGKIIDALCNTIEGKLSEFKKQQASYEKQVDGNTDFINQLKSLNDFW